MAGVLDGVVVSFRAFLISHHPRWRGWWGRVVGRGLVVENCTVDASIFDSLVSLPASVVAGFAWWRWVWVLGDAGVRVFVGLCVAKMLRAHGGCLGTRSR